MNRRKLFGIVGCISGVSAWSLVVLASTLAATPNGTTRWIAGVGIWFVGIALTTIAAATYPE